MNGREMNKTESDSDRTALADFQNTLIGAVRRADRTGANALIDSWAVHYGYDHLFVNVLEPVLEKIGEEWRASESFSIAQAYVAAKIAEDLLVKAAEHRQLGQPPQPTKGTVVLGNIEEDFHGLGRRMVATFLRSEGWSVEDLGNDVLPQDFVDKAQETGARVIGVSAMMMTTARNVRKLREEIDSRGLTGRIQLAVGGAVFRLYPDLVKEVGGDGTSASALGAPHLIAELWERSLKAEARV